MTKNVKSKQDPCAPCFEAAVDAAISEDLFYRREKQALIQACHLIYHVTNSFEKVADYLYTGQPDIRTLILLHFLQALKNTQIPLSRKKPPSILTTVLLKPAALAAE